MIDEMAILHIVRRCKNFFLRKFGAIFDPYSNQKQTCEYTTESKERVQERSRLKF